MTWVKRAIGSLEAITPVVAVPSMTLLVLLLMVTLLAGAPDTASANHLGVEPAQCDNGQPEIPMTEAAGYAIAAGFSGTEAETILAIAWAESGGNRWACNHNPPREVSLGILQLNALAHSAVHDDLGIAFEPQRAFQFARGIFLASGFQPWGAYTDERYETYLPDAREALYYVAGTTPTNFIGTAVSPTQINLTWSDTNYEANFDVWRYRWQGFGWEVVTTLPANTTAYNDTGLLSDSYYYYAIRAYAGNISSGFVYFGWVSTPGAPVAAPSNFTGVAVSTTQINLFWQDNATNEQNYELWRYRWQGFGWEVVTTLPANTTSYGNTGVLPNSYYYYAIRANGTTTASEWIYFGWIKTP